MRVCNANAQIATFKSVNASPGTPPEPGGSHAGLRLPHGAEASTGRCQVSIDQTTLLGLRKSPQAGLCRYPLEGSGRAGPAEQTTARRNLAIQAPANMADPQLAVQDLWATEGGRTPAPCHKEEGPGGGTRSHGDSTPEESCSPISGSDLGPGGRSGAWGTPWCPSSWTLSFWVLHGSRLIGCSARFDDLQHVRPDELRTTSNTIELQAWQTKVARAARIRTRPVPLICPKCSFSGAPWHLQFVSTVRKLSMLKAFEGMDYLLPTISKGLCGTDPATIRRGSGPTLAQGRPSTPGGGAGTCHTPHLALFSGLHSGLCLPAGGSGSTWGTG